MRECVMAGGEMSADGDDIVIKGMRWPKSTVTPLTTGGTATHLTLGSLYLVQVAKGKTYREYMSMAKDAGAQRVRVVNRKAVEQYLDGTSDGKDMLAKASETPAAAAVAAAKAKKRTRDEAAVASAESGAAELGAGVGYELTEDLVAAKRAHTELLDAITDATLSAAEAAEADERELQMMKVADPFVVMTRSVAAAIKARETIVRTRLGELESNTRDFADVVKMITPQSSKSRSSKSAADRSRAVKGTPIIIVPSAMTATLNLLNAQMFLQDGKYVTPAEGAEIVERRPDNPHVLRIDRKDTRGEPRKYYIVDDPLAAGMREDDWQRVVAVFVHGPEWQFKGWLWKTPQEIFGNVPTFTVVMDSEAVHPNLNKWKGVTQLKLSRMHRHLDRAAAMELWNTCDQFLYTKRPGLRERAHRG